MIYENIEIDNFYLLVNLIVCLFMYLGIRLSYKYQYIFGKCVSNEKTSIPHGDMIRGFGILYLISIVAIIFQFKFYFTTQEVILVVASVVLGFFDDKVNISQKYKVLILTLFYIIFSFCKFTDLNIYNLIYSYFTFIFLVLFFNQIDGIDGLATSNFLIVLLLFIFYMGGGFILAPIFLVTIIYLYFNLFTNIGIQGESGSFFFGSIIYILFIEKSYLFLDLKYLIFLGPVLFDISFTTIVRYLFGENIFLGHRNNLYQKLSSKYKNNILIITCFGAFQLLFSFIYIYIELNTYNLYEIFYFVLYCFVLSLLFMTISYKIQTKKYLN